MDLMPAKEKHLLDTFQKQRKRSLALRAEPLSNRINRLLEMEKWIHTHREKIKKAVHADFHKPLLEVDTSEVYPVLTELRHTIKHLERWAAPKKVDATIAYIGTRSEIQYEPKGTCLIIAPWNFPFNLCIGPLVSCLAAGNTAIVKPSEMTPNTSRLVTEMIDELFEEDMVCALEGGVELSQQLLALPFDHIFFTGSPAVGKLVMRAAAQHLTSVTLELGGKSPTIIDASADLKDAAKRIAFGKFLNNGQTCIAPDYVLVEDSIKEKFIDILKKEVQGLFGNGKPIDENAASYGRLVNAKHFRHVHELLTDALQRGATELRLGTSNESENFMAPVILTDIPADARLWEEEIFGPVLPVISYTSTDEIVALINERPKPLALYIFSRRKKFQDYILKSISSGTACINECVLQFSHPNLPFGGVNNSGIGKSHGEHGFMAFSNEKAVLRQKRGWAAPYLLHPPYTSRMKWIVDLLLKWF